MQVQQSISPKVLQTLIAEATAEGPEGMQAVAETIRNRMREWGMTAEEVVTQGGQFAPHSYKPGASVRKLLSDPDTLAKATAAWTAAEGEDDPTGGALFFASGGQRPTANSPLEVVATIGNHRFFAPAGADVSNYELVTKSSPPEVVKALQEQLAAQGFDPGPVDGKLGGQTRAAVKAFQQANGLAVDGKPGMQTLGTLNPAPLPRARPEDGPQAAPAMAGLRPFDPATDKPRLNPDGSRSTEVTRTVQTPTGWANVPSLYFGGAGGAPTDLGNLSDDELAGIAMDYERQSGRSFPRYESLPAAEQAAVKRSAAGGATNAPLAPPPDMGAPTPLNGPAIRQSTGFRNQQPESYTPFTPAGDGPVVDDIAGFYGAETPRPGIVDERAGFEDHYGGAQAVPPSLGDLNLGETVYDAFKPLLSGLGPLQAPTPTPSRPAPPPMGGTLTADDMAVPFNNQPQENMVGGVPVTTVESMLARQGKPTDMSGTVNPSEVLAANQLRAQDAARNPSTWTPPPTDSRLPRPRPETFDAMVQAPPMGPQASATPQPAARAAPTDKAGVEMALQNDVMEGMKPETLSLLNAAADAGRAAGLDRIRVLGAMDVGPQGHKSHFAGTELDISGVNADGSLWTPEQRVAVATAAATVGGNRFGFYTGPNRSLHMGTGPEGFKKNAAWGPNNQTEGVPLSDFHPAERGFVQALRSGSISEFVGAGPDKVMALQTALNENGAGLTVDGNFGGATASALARQGGQIRGTLDQTTFNLHSRANDALITGSQPPPMSSEPAAPAPAPAPLRPTASASPPALSRSGRSPPPMSEMMAAANANKIQAVSGDPLASAFAPQDGMPTSLDERMSVGLPGPTTGPAAPQTPAPFASPSMSSVPITPKPVPTQSLQGLAQVDLNSPPVGAFAPPDMTGAPAQAPAPPIAAAAQQAPKSMVPAPDMTNPPAKTPDIVDNVLGMISSGAAAVKALPGQVTDFVKDGIKDPIDLAAAEASANGTFDAKTFWDKLEADPSLLDNETRQAKAARIAAKGNALFNGGNGPPPMGTRSDTRGSSRSGGSDYGGGSSYRGSAGPASYGLGGSRIDQGVGGAIRNR